MPPPEKVLAEARSARESGDFEAALRLLDSADPVWRDGPVAADLARLCYQGMGESTAALGEANRVLRSRADAASHSRARFAFGRLRETEPGWLPQLPRVDRAWDPIPGRILHLLKESLPFSETGFTFRSRMTLEAHRRAGWDPVVLTSVGFPETKGVEGAARRDVVHGVEHFRVASPFADPVAQVAYDLVLSHQARSAAEEMGEIRPSLIQAGTGFRGYDQMLVGRALADAFRLPLVYEVRGFQEQTWTTDVDRSTKGEYFRRRRAKENECFERADRVITIAEAMKEDIIDRGVAPDDVHVVPNAVDVERFTPRASDPDLRRALGLGDGPVMGYISNLGWREGIHLLIQAMPRVLAAIPDARCLIVGDGPERERLTTLAADLGLGSKVMITGHVANDRIEDHYALIDLFVVPRVRDRASDLVTPLKPLEAMAMGRPVLVSDLPALREIAAPGERGETFTPEDGNDLADKAIELLRDESMRDRFGSEGSRWVRAERTLDSNVERYRAALAGLV